MSPRAVVSLWKPFLTPGFHKVSSWTKTQPLVSVYNSTNVSYALHKGYPTPVDIEGAWFKDGMPVTTPDYIKRMDQTSASLVIEEAFGDDSATFVFRLITPFGEAETSGVLTVSETHKSLASINEEVVTVVKRQRPQEMTPILFEEDLEMGEAPKFTRSAKVCLGCRWASSEQSFEEYFCLP